MQPVRPAQPESLGTKAGIPSKAGAGFVVSFRVDRRNPDGTYALTIGNERVNARSTASLVPGSAGRGVFTETTNGLQVEPASVRERVALSSGAASRSLSGDVSLFRAAARAFAAMGQTSDRRIQDRACAIARKSEHPERAVAVYAAALASGVELPEQAVTALSDWEADGNGQWERPAGDATDTFPAAFFKAFTELGKNAQDAVLATQEGDREGEKRRFVCVPLELRSGDVDFSGFLLLYFGFGGKLENMNAFVDVVRPGREAKQVACTLTPSGVTLSGCDVFEGEAERELARSLAVLGFSFAGRVLPRAVDIDA